MSTGAVFFLNENKTEYRYKLRFAFIPVLAEFDYGETPEIIWMRFYWKVEEVSTNTGEVWSTWNTKNKRH